MDSDNSINSPITYTPSPFSASQTPIQLSGFLAGDTIQVTGDTGDLRFSVRLDLVNKKLFAEEKPVEPEDEEEVFDSFTSSVPYATAIASPGESISDHRSESAGIRGGATTRLRSGAISPVSYFPRASIGRSGRVRSGRNNKKIGDALERMWRRRSFPVRPCTSYSFFVMSSWGRVKASSFAQTSKRIAQMWYKLPTHQKQLYEDMAVKDSERYKWQAELFADNQQRPFKDVHQDHGL